MDEHKQGTLQSWGSLFSPSSEGSGAWRLGGWGGCKCGEVCFLWKVKKVPRGQHDACCCPLHLSSVFVCRVLVHPGSPL